jgi:hypothetical protein
MKKSILLVLLLVCVSAFAQSNSVYNATTYAYATQVAQGNSLTGSASIVANPTAFALGIPFLPYNTNASITINRNAATAETVTLSSIANCYPNSLTCTLYGSFSYKHISGETIQSGTFGLQEAINVAMAAGSGTVLIDASWQGPSGTSLITSAKGNNNVMIQDNRNPSGAEFYQWNGSAYAQSGGPGVTTINGANGAITFLNGTNMNIVQNPSGTFTFNCSGCSGGSGSGVVSNGTAHQFTYYAAGGTTVTGHPQLWTIDSTMNLSQVNALIASLNCGSCDGTYNSLIVPDGVAFQPWTNQTAGFPAANPGVGGADLRTGTHYQQMTFYGIVPDALNKQFTTNSTTTIVVPSYQPFACPNSTFPCTSGGDVGKTITFGAVIGNYYTGTQYRYVGLIQSIQSITSATMSVAVPFSASSVSGWEGTDNCSAFTSAMTGLAGDLTGALPSQGLMGILPAGYMLTTCTIPWSGSVSWMGQNMSDSFIVGSPAKDVVQSSNNGGVGLYFGRVQLLPDGSISASQHPYTDVEANGTTTTVQPFYRPLHVGQPDSNNPLAQGWCASCDGNYVANITQNSAVICIPTALGRTPAIGDEIVFPYTPTVFQSTVSSTAGSCGTGLSPITISPAIPNTTGYTLTQTPLYASKAAAGIQHLASAIAAGPMNYPVTITLANPTYPYVGSINNVAPHGHIQIGSEQYDYMGCSYVSPYTCTLRAGPATTVGWSAMTPVVPLNPCYADFAVPYPVVPTVNSGQATPVGAVYFPGQCGGNFGLAEPNLNGLTDTAGSFFRAHLEDVGIYPQNINPGKGVGGYYGAGNHMPYATTFNDWRIFGGDFGIAEGPASENEWNIASAGPTGDGNEYLDFSVTSAYVLSLIGQENTNVNRWDAYSTEYSPFDGTAVGGTSAIYLGYTLAETTGGGVQNTAYDWVNNWNAEPENGSHIESPPYLYSGCSVCVFHANTFEGAGAVIDGSNNVISGGQLSANATVPAIIYGNNNTITDTIDTATGKISNVYGIGTVLNWGSNNNISVASAYGSGQNIAPAPGLREKTSGYDSGSFRDGLAATPYVTDKEGYFSPYEFSPTVLNGVDPSPFQVAYTPDPTAPVSGGYVGCDVSASSGCLPFHIGGFFGYYYIGQDNRVAAIPYVVTTAFKTTNNQTFNFLVNTISDGTPGSTCGGFQQETNEEVTTVGGQWTTVSYPANFTGATGCIIQFGVYGSTSADVVQVAYMDFQPVPKSAFLTTVSSSIEGTSCTVPALLGTDGSYTYWCTGTVVKRSPIS